ncbi:MAG TPA: hypothetical protein VM925_10730 [Labilithrix sp.]|nr:hypothetical protein [Labilithrix sp.]
MCLLVVLGALIFFPAVRAPLFLDDFLHGAMVEGSYPVPRGPFDLYDFIGDDNRALLLDRGFLPWWTEKHLTVRFFRPLASALLYVEHRVFSHAALPMHLHSFAWWIGAILAARALFRRTLADRPARIATVIFALAPCHALPIAWLANRATLIALTLGTVGLVLYAQWRQERRVRHALLGGALFVLAFLGGGEYALAFGGYVVAIEAVRRKETLLRRASGLLPFIVPAIGYLAWRRAGGYGSRGSGFYTDPLQDAGAFLADAPMRAASLLGASWLTLDIGWWRSGGIAEWFLVAILLGSAIVLVPLIRRMLVRLPEPNRRSATWLLFGSLLALLPSLAVAPGARVLGASMLGVAPIVSLFLDRIWFPSEDTEAEAPSRFGQLAPLVAVALGFAHLIHGPGSAFLSARAQRESAVDFATRIDVIRSQVEDAAHSELGVIRGLASVFFMPFAIDLRSPPPPRWFVLAHTSHVLALRRDERTIDLVAPADTALYPMSERSLYRSPRARLRKGDEIRISGLRVKILEASALGPRIARFVFDQDPTSIPWASDDYEELRRVKLPDVGFGDIFDARPLNASPTAPAHE